MEMTYERALDEYYVLFPEHIISPEFAAQTDLRCKGVRAKQLERN